jgi:hypothetical protein
LHHDYNLSEGIHKCDRPTRPAAACGTIAPCCIEEEKEARLSRSAMAQEDDDVKQSMARVRRGCLGSTALFCALAILFVTATGNLFYLLFLVGAAISLVLWRLTR